MAERHDPHAAFAAALSEAGIAATPALFAALAAWTTAATAATRAALAEARAFVAAELAVRRASFGADEPDYGAYVKPAEDLLATLDAALAELGPSTWRNETMNPHATAVGSAPILVKPDPSSPVFKVLDRDKLVVKAGTTFAGHRFDDDAPIPFDAAAASPGADYIVTFAAGELRVATTTDIPSGETLLGGFHYAPGGNAPARGGGDDTPAINPFSLWDVAFRPACRDPRGMTLVRAPSGPFWCDIYLAGANHFADGTSRFGVMIADGVDLPCDAKGKKAKRFDYKTASAVMAAHGKGLLSLEEFFAAAFGVTEKSAVARDPAITGLDAPRTSRWGLMQATGNLWIWGHDGDPDAPRASIFGASWLGGDDAGSRYASVAHWPGYSRDNLGARGRSDHLQPV